MDRETFAICRGAASSRERSYWRQFATGAWRAGLTGYVYDQFTRDGGSDNDCGPSKFRVAGAAYLPSYSLTVSHATCCRCKATSAGSPAV